MQKIARILIPICLFLTLSAHDYWLEAENYLLKKGETLVLHLLVGGDLDPEIERPLQKEQTLSFQLHTAQGSKDLLASQADSTFPVLKQKVDFEGLGLISMERDFSLISLHDTAFHNYLLHEYLIGVIEQRKKIGHRTEEKERYARAIKALVKSGSNATQGKDLYKKRLGQKLEIILLQNPYELKAGDIIEAQLFYDQQPLTNKPIMALHKDPQGKFSELITYTDEEGKAIFRLKESGFWLIRSLHLYPCENCGEVNWESYWASYSFVLP